MGRSRIVLGGLCAAVITLVGGTSALAATTATLATPGGAASPAVAVASDGSAVVAWADTAVSPNTIQWCVIPSGAAACTKTGSLQPADSAQYVDNVQVLNEGTSIVILGDVFATSNSKGFVATDYEQVQEWQSTDGGQSFNQQASGKAVASGDPSNDTEPIGAVTLPGGSSLGFAFKTASGYPTFHAFDLAGPTTCGRAAGACPDGYATLQPSTNPDQISNPSSANVAANGDGVLGIYGTNSTSGPLGCSNATTVPFGFAFVFGDGVQSASNNYNLSPGQPKSAWRVAAAQGDCNVEYPAVGGGPSGFGVLETNDLTKQTQYHHYDGIANSFATTKPVVVSTGIEQQPAVSQDGAGGVYATYLAGGIGGPVSLSYSYDGGTTWSGPNTLAADPAGKLSGLTSSVNPSGQGWAVWTENGSVYGLQFTAADSVAPAAPTALTTSQTAGSTTGASITVPAGTVGETDRATLTGTAATKATGTVSYSLFSSPACTAGSQVASSSVTVSGGAVPASAPVAAALAAGSYYWQASYSGNAGNTQGAVANAASVSACGSEILTVAPAPVASPGPGTVTPPAAGTVTAAHTATSNGRTVTVTLTCSQTPCTVTLSLAAGTTSAKTTRAAAGKRKRRQAVSLGSGTFTLTKARQTVTLKLSKAGRTLLNRHHGHVKLKLTVTQKRAGGTTSAQTSTLAVTRSAHKPAKKRKR